MELLDRAYQRTLLEALGDRFPKYMEVTKMPPAKAGVLYVNAQYLAEHGLITVNWLGRERAVLGSACITAKGIDFLQDDGGLSAILGVVTVRLHADTLRDLLVRQVEASDEDPTVRQQVAAKIKALPAEAIGKLSERAMEAGIARIPGIAQWAMSAIQGLAG